VTATASRRRQGLLSTASRPAAADAKTISSSAKPVPSFSKLLLSLADLHALGISYSRQHIYRLVAEGRFPRPVALGPELYARKAWRSADVEQWLAALTPRMRTRPPRRTTPALQRGGQERR
jgi:prophage regulatory protein